MRVIGWLQLSGLVLAVLLPAARKQRGTRQGESRSWPKSGKTRHSEGTFTSDFTHYLDRLKAKDFVHWLINTKRYRYN
uniref:Glucagon / GIP / secretin / VIP family domain-containing protein n=1 Tax=Dromaius novaehollandiae TaxID=8790 RepID=A0A8C4KQ59_DRONO